MTATAVSTAEPTTSRTAPARPELVVIDRRSSRRRSWRRNALVLLFVAVLTGFFGVAWAHAKLVESQHELDRLRTEINEMEAERARIARAIEESSSPEVVVGRAAELGMVRAAEPVFLEATDHPNVPVEVTVDPTSVAGGRLGSELALTAGE